jgi:hypothetical protein
MSFAHPRPTPLKNKELHARMEAYERRCLASLAATVRVLSPAEIEAYEAELRARRGYGTRVREKRSGGGSGFQWPKRRKK